MLLLLVFPFFIVQSQSLTGSLSALPGWNELPTVRHIVRPMVVKNQVKTLNYQFKICNLYNLSWAPQERLNVTLSGNGTLLLLDLELNK